MINIYCDESCHLEHDKATVMLLGALACEKSAIKKASHEIRAIKANYGIVNAGKLCTFPNLPAKGTPI